MNRFWGIVATVFLLTATVQAQTTIKGVVFNKETNEPVESANIYIKDFAIGTITDDDGYFSLRIPDSLSQNYFMVIDHVAFDTLQISIAKALKTKEFPVSPKTRSTEKIIVEAQAKSELARELPVSMAIIDVERIESKGFVDAGDLLRINQSVQVDEDLSGKKIISIRAGNPENVLVLYNGIRMNNNYDNIFDLSTINVEDIKQIEIISGSNTSLYGSEALSGVVNIVPKLYQDHQARFIQKFGSYNSGDWSLQLNQNLFERLYVSYSQRRAGSERQYGGSSDFLQNRNINHTAHVTYNFEKNSGDSTQNEISLMYMQGSVDYSNTRLLETTNDLNRITALGYKGNIGPVNKLDIKVSYQQTDNKQGFSVADTLVKRDINNEKLSIDVQKSFNIRSLNFTAAYQYDYVTLGYGDNRIFLAEQGTDITSLDFIRNKTGLVGLVTLESDEDAYTDKIRLAASIRYDKVSDEQKDIGLRSENPGVIENINNDWDDTMFKASAQVINVHNDIQYSVMFNTGTNVRYPTLFNQLSTQSVFESEPALTSKLAPEKNRSFEGSFTMSSNKVNVKNIDFWQVSVTYFKNLYENKFRNFYSLYSPFALYDNVKNAELSGIETNVKLYFFNHALIAEGGISSYDISEKAAFPLKSDIKYVANLFAKKWGFDFELNWFKAGSQVGWFRNKDNDLVESELPGYTNMNVHLSKEWEIFQFRTKLNLSIVNLLSNSRKFNGLATHDQRIYAGFEIKY